MICDINRFSGFNTKVWLASPTMHGEESVLMLM